jgi:FxsC-like protein
MAYEFFFSYTRADNDDYLKAFLKDLSEEVRLRRGLPAGTEVGFFDQREIELGEDWDAEIVQALQTSRVMICLSSPAYFKSEYCGKEWALFRRRCQAALTAAGQVPPLQKSVLWIEHPIALMPAEVQANQLTLGDPHAVHNVKGARHLLRRQGRQDADYIDLIDSLTTQIVQAADAYPMAALAQVPILQSVPSAFHAAPAMMSLVAQKPAVPVSVGPRQVNFIYVAAHPNDIAGARPVDDYADAGGGDWRPFYPSNQRQVHPLMQYIAADPALDFSSVEVPFGADLIERVQEAWKQRQIVVIVVDAWSLHWDSLRAKPQYRQLLQTLDGRFDYHWCVLVPWNEQDAALQAQSEQIRNVVRATFDRHARLMPNPMFYRDGIRSIEEFRAAVAEVLTRLKEEIRRTADVLRVMPAGPARAVVTGPAG